MFRLLPESRNVKLKHGRILLKKNLSVNLSPRPAMQVLILEDFKHMSGLTAGISKLVCMPRIFHYASFLVLACVQGQGFIFVGLHIHG